jgi:hypothetical protein
MRTETRRFTAWVPFDNITDKVAWDHPADIALELYVDNVLSLV